MRRNSLYWLRVPAGLLGLFAVAGAALCPSARAEVLDKTTPLQYVPLDTPCRAVDTRQTGGPIAAATFRNLNPTGGACANTFYNPSGGPIAYALNVTAVPHGPLGFLTIWPAGELQPTVSTMNAQDGRTKANAAIVTGGSSGGVSVYVSSSADVILDVSGYFIVKQVPPGTDTFFPITPCRVVDTRLATGEFGGPSLAAGQQRIFDLGASACNLPASTARAYALNVTAVPKGGKPVGYLTVWGFVQTNGEQPPPPKTSILNAPTGAVTANAAIVSASPDLYGTIAAVASDDTDVVIDVTGYFVRSDSPSTGGLSLYILPPCRVLDSRKAAGEFKGQLAIHVTSDNNCSVPDTAQAFVFNATVVPTGALGYLTLWPNQTPKPAVSTLNANDGFVSSNMAIVSSGQGAVDAYASSSTQLILDLSGYFAP